MSSLMLTEPDEFFQVYLSKFCPHQTLYAHICMYMYFQEKEEWKGERKIKEWEEEGREEKKEGKEKGERRKEAGEGEGGKEEKVLV